MARRRGATPLRISEPLSACALLLGGLVLLLGVWSVVDGVDPFSFRAGKSRRQSAGYAFENYESRCQANCEAQFRRDFQDSLHASYDADFFDFPIDPLLTKSSDNFNTFCQLVEEKLECLRDECDQTDLTITPQNYLCIQQRPKFEQALDCLNQTAPYLQCHSSCSKAARRSLSLGNGQPGSGRSYFESELSQLTVLEMQQYEAQDLRCRFQACALECRKMLIRGHCDAEEAKTQTIQTVTSYYSSDLNEDQQLFQRHSNLRLFPKFCSFFLAYMTNDTNVLEYQMKDYEPEPSFVWTMRALKKASDAAP